MKSKMKYTLNTLMKSALKLNEEKLINDTELKQISEIHKEAVLKDVAIQLTKNYKTIEHK